MYWIFNMWKHMQLRRYAQHPAKVEREGENIISATALGVNNEIAAALPGLRGLRIRLSQLRTRIAESLFNTDQWGNKEPLVQPAFTPDRVSKLRRQRIGLLLVVLGFVMGEVGLYFLISENLIGGLKGLAHDIAVWGLALVFALFVLFAFAFALDKLFDFIDARELFGLRRIPKRAYQKALTDLVWGAVLFTIAFGFLTYAGIARINLIEKAAAAANTSLTPELRAVVEQGGRAAGIMALLFTYGMAILLGVLKRALQKAKSEWAAYKAWQANTTEQERIVKRIGEIVARVLGELPTELEKGVQLMHEMQRIYGIQVDASREELYRAYEEERAKPGFTVTRDVLNRFRPVVATDEQLFTAAVMEKLSLKALREALDDESLPAVTSLDALYAHIGKGAPKADPKREVNEPAPSLNGHATPGVDLKELLNA